MNCHMPVVAGQNQPAIGWPDNGRFAPMRLRFWVCSGGHAGLEKLPVTIAVSAELRPLMPARRELTDRHMDHRVVTCLHPATASRQKSPVSPPDQALTKGAPKKVPGSISSGMP